MHNAHYIDKLRERIEMLEKRLKESEELFERVRKANRETFAVVMEHIRHDDAERADLFERLKGIEFHLFPRLGDDLVQLTDIIGEECGDRKKHSLDRKKL